MNISDLDKLWLNRAVTQSKISVRKGCFPAGAIVARPQGPFFRGISDSYPGYQHAEIRAIQKASGNIRKTADSDLIGFTLFTSMEPCLMCLTTAYQAGIRRILYVIPKQDVSPAYYEGSQTSKEVIQNFHQPTEFLHVSELQEQALKIVRDWEISRLLTNF